MMLESKDEIIEQFGITLHFRDEIDVVKNTSYYRAFNFSFFFSASRFILLCTFLVYGFTGEVGKPCYLNTVCSIIFLTRF